MENTIFLSHTAAAKQWELIGTKHHHGIAVPLSSLHSLHSSGIGEYTDLPQLIDWCASIGFDVIQLLPLNDTDMQTSPYGAISAFALNPIYLGLHALPYLQEFPVLKEALKSSPNFFENTTIDYLAVKEYKERFLTHYLKYAKQKLLSSTNFVHFMRDANFWIKGYAAFKILKLKNQFTSWQDWSEAEKNPDAAFIDTIISSEKETFDAICLVQYLCDQQLRAANMHGIHKQVFIMGDIPILIARDSADVWLHRTLFDLHYSAGAPPDPLGEFGQNWGFPIYCWDELANQNYRWWIQRLRWAERYYCLYRIDHVVGLFRLWSIPEGKNISEGKFIPENESIWIEHGKRILLSFLKECKMLPIGEDLGTVPPEVRGCLNELGICGTRVMRWERKWSGDKAFILPLDYAIDTMSTLSTHDTETIQQWWSNRQEEAEAFAKMKGWTYHPILSREHHHAIIWDSHHTSSLFHINPLQEYFALLPGFSWPKPEDERINTPGTVNERNWSYRLRPSLEELSQQETLKHIMRALTI